MFEDKDLLRLIAAIASRSAIQYSENFHKGAYEIVAYDVILCNQIPLL
jgi:hypothetical protein